MKIKKVSSYTPNYPSKLKGRALKLGAAAAAVVIAAGASGCLPRASGYMEYRDPTITEETEIITDDPVLTDDVEFETEDPDSAPDLLGLIIAPGTVPTDDGNVLDAPRDTIAPPDNG